MVDIIVSVKFRGRKRNRPEIGGGGARIVLKPECKMFTSLLLCTLYATWDLSSNLTLFPLITIVSSDFIVS